MEEAGKIFSKFPDLEAEFIDLVTITKSTGTKIVKCCIDNHELIAKVQITSIISLDYSKKGAYK